MKDYSIIENNIETIKVMAAKGDSDAQNKLGVGYKAGVAGLPKSYDEAVKWFLKAAEQGLPKAQYNLAICYRYGEGVVQDFKAAAEWFAKAAAQCNASAQFELGYCYEFGVGVRKNLKAAVKWYMKAAEQGNPNAQTNLAYCYEAGIGTPQNYQEAIAWYTKAIENGNTRAMTNLGSLYERGLGVEIDYAKAVEWYTKASELGYARATNNLGFMYEKGRGVDKDEARAFSLYQKASDLGYAYALYNKGYCYEYGIGIKKNYKEAVSCYSHAVEEGIKAATEALKRAEEKLWEEEEFKKIKFSTRQRIGNTVYSRVIPFGKNYIVKRKGLWGVVDKDEKVLLPIEYTRVHWFEGGYAGIQINNKWGLVKSDGVITIDPQYDTLHYITEFEACEVEANGERFVVDAHNKVVLKLEGETILFEGNKLVARSKNGWRLYNLDGTPFSEVHAHIHCIGERYIGYDGGGQEVLINSKGKEVKLPDFETGVFFEHITPFRYQDKYGIIDENANIVVPNQYDFIDLGSGVIAINEGNVSKDRDAFFHAYPFQGEWYLWNYQFQPITPYRYTGVDHAYKEEEKIWFAKRDGRWYQITPEGETLFAESEEEYKKRKANIKKDRKEKAGWGKFHVLEDRSYQGENGKYFVQTCDGYLLHHYYYSPYLPTESNMVVHMEIGDFFVNKYGQDMHNPYAFKRPKQKAPRYVFKLNPDILKLSEKEMIGVYADLLKPSGFTKKEITTLYLMLENQQKRAILCDWMLRKQKRKKSFKFDFDELSVMAFAVDKWWKKRKAGEGKNKSAS